jgi:4-amino-4-deoxy-L-arabinose transferase-like glycosyltransferase
MIKKEHIKLILSDIRFWILFFFIIRLIGIANAPLEIGHNWRQSLTNMIARNFMEGNSNIFYPRIDMAGNQTGFIGSEFPFYNYLIYMVSWAFHYSHWYGRLINLIVSSFGIYFFYRLIEKICNRKIAFNASIVFLSSIWFAFSRKTMPDTFSVSLVIMGLYYCYMYLTAGSWLKLFLFFILTTLGMLCKIPALSLVSVISVLTIVKEISIRKKLVVLLLTSISLAVVSLWYFYWVPYLVDTYHYQLYFPKGLSEGFKEILQYLPEFFEKFYFGSLCSYIALPFLLLGIFFIFKKGNLYLKTGIFVITFTFFIFILKTGSVFPLHSYYIIPFTPVMALMVGYGLNKIPAKYLYIPVVLIAMEGIGNQQHDFFIKNSERYKLTLEDLADKNIGKNELIVINGGQSPQEIYFVHRKGWTIDNKTVTKEELKHLSELGASYLIIDKNSFNSTIEYYPMICSDANFSIYKLN